MRPLLLLSCLLCLTACDQQKTAAERTEEIENFAEPAINAYHKAEQVQDVVNTAAEKRRPDDMQQD